MKRCTQNTSLLITVAAWMLLLGANTNLIGAETHAGRIKIEYFAPKNSKQQSVYDILRERQALEQLQKVFSPFRLPVDLTLQSVGCEGVANAWYERARVTLCYELLSAIRWPATTETAWAGISQKDAVVGQFLYIAGHEVGHAIFNLINVPIFGNEEDAADQFAIYLMLRLGKEQARRLILGAAYYYKKHLAHRSVTMDLEAFSNAHSKPPQRFYNLLCMAYGANSSMFADVVDQGYLPKERATGCQREYRRVAHAIQVLIIPHLEPEIAKDVLDETWLSAPQ
jgi:Putative metallopeptidase